MKRKQRLKRDKLRISNLEELRRLKLLHGLEVWKFSEIHFRIIGKNVVDYWPSRGTAWLVGSIERGMNLGVSEVCELAMGIIPSPADLLNAQMDAEFRNILK